MAEAEVGDDQYGEDPTVKPLEEAYAARVGKPAAVFVPSGVMANQIALRVLCRPGGLVIAGRRQHVVIYEHGAAARNAGIQFYELDDDDGDPRPRRPSPGPVPPSTTTIRCRSSSAWSRPTCRRAVMPWTSPRWRPSAAAGPAYPSIWTGPVSSTPRWPRARPAAAFAGPGHHGDVLSLEGPLRPRRVGPGRSGRRDGRGPGRATAAGRGHAPGRGDRRRRPGRPCAPWWSAWPTTTTGPGGWPEAVAERWPEAGCDPDRLSHQHGHLQPPRSRPSCWRSCAERGSWRERSLLASVRLRHPPRRRRRRCGHR
jgi:hypothetical protein